MLRLLGVGVVAILAMVLGGIFVVLLVYPAAMRFCFYIVQFSTQFGDEFSHAVTAILVGILVISMLVLIATIPVVAVRGFWNWTRKSPP